MLYLRELTVSLTNELSRDSTPSLNLERFTAKGVPLSMSGYKWTGDLRPKYPLSVKRVVPDHIVRPDYADQRK